MTQSDWNPQAYTRFSGLRLRPALDLLAQVGPLPEGDVCDLGCGTGVMAADLRLRCEGQTRLVGVDQSRTMLDEAHKTGLYDRLDQADAALWSPHAPLALIYSNALLHWLPDHPGLLPRLADMLVPGGVLAVQVPHQNARPSHATWVSLADEASAGGAGPSDGPGVLSPEAYFSILEPLGQVNLWETEYVQLLPPADDGHPVRRFTESTFARPILNALPPDRRAELIAAYDDRIGQHYPLRPDGSVVFPFRRLFFVLVRPYSDAAGQHL